jgi:hypothetical protein
MGGPAGAGPDAGASLDAAPPRPADHDARPEGSIEAAREAGRADAPPQGPAARVPGAGEIVIDELLVDPAGNDLGHEWIEIANVASEPLDLGGLRVADETTEAAVDAGVLPAGGLLVLGQSIDRAHNGDAPVDLAYGTRLTLNNGADRVEICLGPCGGGVVLDAVGWSAAWGDTYVGHAVVVERGGRACPAAEAYGAGGNFGTPGRANPPCPVVAPDPPGVDGGPSRDGTAPDGDGAADDGTGGP